MFIKKKIFSLLLAILTLFGLSFTIISCGSAKRLPLFHIYSPENTNSFPYIDLTNTEKYGDLKNIDANCEIALNTIRDNNGYSFNIRNDLANYINKNDEAIDITYSFNPNSEKIDPTNATHFDQVQMYFQCDPVDYTSYATITIEYNQDNPIKKITYPFTLQMVVEARGYKKMIIIINLNIIVSSLLPELLFDDTKGKQAGTLVDSEWNGQQFVETTPSYLYKLHGQDSVDTQIFFGQNTPGITPINMNFVYSLIPDENDPTAVDCLVLSTNPIKKSLIISFVVDANHSISQGFHAFGVLVSISAPGYATERRQLLFSYNIAAVDDTNRNPFYIENAKYDYPKYTTPTDYLKYNYSSYGFVSINSYLPSADYDFEYNAVDIELTGVNAYTIEDDPNGVFSADYSALGNTGAIINGKNFFVRDSDGSSLVKYNIDAAGLNFAGITFPTGYDYFYIALRIKCTATKHGVVGAPIINYVNYNFRIHTPKNVDGSNWKGYISGELFENDFTPGADGIDYNVWYYNPTTNSNYTKIDIDTINSSSTPLTSVTGLPLADTVLYIEYEGRNNLGATNRYKANNLQIPAYVNWRLSNSAGETRDYVCQVSWIGKNFGTGGADTRTIFTGNSLIEGKLVTFPTLFSVGMRAFDGSNVSYYQPVGDSTIGPYAFQNCPKFENLDFSLFYGDVAYRAIYKTPKFCRIYLGSNDYYSRAIVNPNQHLPTFNNYAFGDFANGYIDIDGVSAPYPLNRKGLFIWQEGCDADNDSWINNFYNGNSYDNLFQTYWKTRKVTTSSWWTQQP